jgi:hypothetical protein
MIANANAPVNAANQGFAILAAILLLKDEAPKVLSLAFV